MFAPVLVIMRTSKAEQAVAAEYSVGMQNTGNAAIEAEKKHYRQLAKKLKLKQGRISAVGDGLDDLLAGITSSNMESDEDLAAGVRLHAGCSVTVAFRLPNVCEAAAGVSDGCRCGLCSSDCGTAYR